MRVVGIDPGTNCGWAVWQNGSVYASGTWDLSCRRFEGGGMRFVRFRKFFTDLTEAEKTDLVAFEEVARHAGTAAAHVYGGIVAILQTVCEETKIPYTAIPVATIKRAATGKGNADKAAMVAAANARWGASITDDNEADARWIADVASREVSRG